MRKLHFIAMALMALFCASCVSKSDIEDLQSQIDALKVGKIATIEQQIENIQSSIVTLKDLQKQMEALGVADNALNKRIDDLTKYVDGEIANIKDWSNATFATLEQYQGLLDELARIKKDIPDVEDAIKKSEESMKSWVSEQFAGYYTIAQMDAKLKGLTDADAKIIEDFTKAKEDLVKAYTKAITDAITKYNGDITAKIAADIKTATDALQVQINALDARVSKLEDSACSLTILPYYSDGSVRAEDGILTIMCAISPSSAMGYANTDAFNIFINTTTTKINANNVVHPDYICWTEIDDTFSELEIRADISKFLPLEDGKTLGVSLGFFTENSSIMSNYANITLSFTSEYDKLLIEDIGGNVWSDRDARYVFNPVNGIVWILYKSDNIYQVSANDVWFMDDYPELMNGEEGHYLIRMYGPYSTMFTEEMIFSLHLESDGRLRIQRWNEDESGNLIFDYETYADNYCKKSQYNPTKIKSNFFQMEAPEFDEYIYLGSYCPKKNSINPTNDRCKTLVGLGGEYELVYAGKGKEEDYESIDAKGKCVVVDRGEIGFEEKWVNASNAGAVFVLMVNYDDEHINPDTGAYPEAPFFVVPFRNREQLLRHNGKKFNLFEWEAFI